MIAYVRGVLAEKEPTRVVIEAAGVGYEVLIPLSTYDKLPREGSEAKLLTAHCVREDDEILFGFATEDERELFAKLTSVSGVGPKIAIAMLSGMSIGELAMCITSGDAKRISAVKGVGKKTAEKICIELRDKVDSLAFRGKDGEKGKPSIAADAVAALRSLGFSDETSSKMVADVFAKHPGEESLDAVIRLALASHSS